MNDTHSTSTTRHGTAHVVSIDAPPELGEPSVTVLSAPDFRGHVELIARYVMPDTDEPTWTAVQMLHLRGWWVLSPMPRVVGPGYMQLDVVERAASPAGDTVPADTVVDHVQFETHGASRPGMINPE